MHILDTDRLTLRHLRMDDLQALYALYRGPEMRRYIPNGTLTLEETRLELMQGNLASAKVAQKVGMHFEREERDAWGAFHIYRMAVRA